MTHPYIQYLVDEEFIDATSPRVRAHFNALIASGQLAVEDMNVLRIHASEQDDGTLLLRFGVNQAPEYELSVPPEMWERRGSHELPPGVN